VTTALAMPHLDSQITGLADEATDAESYR